MGEKGKRKKILRDLLSGCLAGGVARLCVAPLDVVKIRSQVYGETARARSGINPASLPQEYRSVAHALREIVSGEGLRALWKGNGPAMFMIVPYGGVQFASYHQLHPALDNYASEPYSSLISGGFAGMFATMCTYPLDLLRTRLAVQREPKIYLNTLDAVTKIYGQEGLRGFYAGIQPTLIEIVPYISLHFAFYEGLTQLYTQGALHGERTKLRPHESLIAGGLSGLGSKLLTYPLDTVKKRLQVQGQFVEEGRYRNFIDAFAKVYRHEGISGLLRGWKPSVIKAVPNSAITFAVFEYSKTFLDRVL